MKDYIYIYIYKVVHKILSDFSIYSGNSVQGIGQMSRVFVNGSGDRDSILVWVIPKTWKMVFDATFLSTQHYTVGNKSKVG